MKKIIIHSYALFIILSISCSDFLTDGIKNLNEHRGIGIVANDFIDTVNGALRFDIDNNDTAGKTYVLLEDIDLNTLTVSLGSNTQPFEGTLDGCGFSITGLNNNSRGLFYKLDGATVKNLNISGASITASVSHIGILTGQADNSTIINVKVSGTVENNFNTTTFVGGLIGRSFNLIISNCSASVIITNNAASGSTAFNYTGGLIGYNSTSSVSNCFATGIVLDDGNTHYSSIGGLVGSNDKSSVINSYATANVTSSNLGVWGHRVGGLIGSNTNDSTKEYEIKGSSATGIVKSDNLNLGSSTDNPITTGGLIGYNILTGSGKLIITDSYSSSQVIASGTLAGSNPYLATGGLVGCNSASVGLIEVNNTHTSGTIDGDGSSGQHTSTGGLVGYNYTASGGSITITSSYSTSTVTGTGTATETNTGGFAGYNNSAAGAGSIAITKSSASGLVTGTGSNTNNTGDFTGKDN